MALRMPSPVAFASGVYRLNICVPCDLTDKVRGTPVTLPIDGFPASVEIGDKVVVSLRTKDVKAAKSRFNQAVAALDMQTLGNLELKVTVGNPTSQPRRDRHLRHIPGSV